MPLSPSYLGFGNNREKFGRVFSPSVPFVGALDAFAPNHAWSHRRALVSSFDGTILQARRTSDDEPYNVARLANGEGDIAGLQSFVGPGSAAVASLTEQMGSGADFVQTTADYQRIIIDGGSLVTVGGKAASRGLRGPITPDVQGGGMYTSSFTSYTGSTISIFLRGAHDAYAAGWFDSIVDAYLGLGRSSDPAYDIYFYRQTTGAAGLSRLGNLGAFNSNYLISIIFDGTNATFRDGTHTTVISWPYAFIHDRFIFGYAAGISAEGNTSLYNRWQEAAVWLSDETSNEAAIRSAMMS